MSKIEMGKEIPFVFSLSLSLSIHSPIVRDFLFKWMNDLLFYSKAGFFCDTKYICNIDFFLALHIKPVSPILKLFLFGTKSSRKIFSCSKMLNIISHHVDFSTRWKDVGTMLEVCRNLISK